MASKKEVARIQIGQFFGSIYTLAMLFLFGLYMTVAEWVFGRGSFAGVLACTAWILSLWFVPKSLIGRGTRDQADQHDDSKPCGARKPTSHANDS